MTTKIIVLGSSGQTGKEALAYALSAPSVSNVFSFGRRSPPVDNLTGANKLTHATLDFEKLLLGKGNAEYEAEANKLRQVDADAVLIALGTTRKNAGSAEAFEKIDREYVLKVSFLVLDTKTRPLADWSADPPSLFAHQPGCRGC